MSDQGRALDLQASLDERDVLHDFEIDVARIPVSLPYAEASLQSRVAHDASAAPVSRRDKFHTEREDGITLFTAFGRFAAATARSP